MKDTEVFGILIFVHNLLGCEGLTESERIEHSKYLLKKHAKDVFSEYKDTLPTILSHFDSYLKPLEGSWAERIRHYDQERKERGEMI